LGLNYNMETKKLSVIAHGGAGSSNEHSDGTEKAVQVCYEVNQNNGIKFGKWILRKAFENDLPSSVIWRKKTPMQDGSGTVGLIKMFDSVITDDIFKEKTKKIKSEDNVTIRTKESLHYYEL